MSCDFKQQNEAADSLIQKLERIGKLWSELPGEDHLEELEKHAHGLAARTILRMPEGVPNSG